MNILGLETSCDETAAAIVTDKREIRSNVVLSQLQEHEIYGGVVPEIAARAHLDHLDSIIRAALHDANMDWDEIDGIAATCGPGLIGGLMIGMMSAKAIAAARKLPFIAVNHLEGHALTARLTDNIEFPYLLLLVSGGHTQILVAEDVGIYKRLGTTLDDAAGECFDKSAKLMGLPHPGGPNLEKIARECTDHEAALNRFPLPRPMKGRKGCDFSFSGLKTAVRTHVQSLPEGPLNRQDIAALAYACETAIADILANRSQNAIREFKQSYHAGTTSPALVVCGGVSANKAIRNRLEELTTKENMHLIAPPLNLCGDNAAMIAWAGLEHLRLGHTSPLDFKARPRWPLAPTAETRPGAGVKA
ncbi:MAG: tRNA (adenosine(37)-N6)-threonylcarbamoyltransferase complex transferase subunit TsaD [Alphaproteobacteria bacterium]|nr:tRNA (adenosine(37)-N6)-threonylcarbamoyltransferase complex transferase subunit TsaD [Alphaproteobacteria bacterium]